MDFMELLNTEKYDFLRTNPRLGNHIMLFGLSGSYGYGTNREGSDIDFRGVTLNFPSDLLGLTSFEQFEDRKTDTVIYGFKKLINLLLNCNPNTIEILGLDEEQYLIRSAFGQDLQDPLKANQDRCVGMAILLEEERILTEPSVCIGLGAVLQGKIPVSPEMKVCFVLSGGNVGLSQLDILR